MRSIHRSILTGALMAGAASLDFVMIGAAAVHAETVIGGGGGNGADCPDFFNLMNEGCSGDAGGGGQTVTASENPAIAIGGNGGERRRWRR